jgi:histidinol-phosphate aminotransferase
MDLALGLDNALAVRTLSKSHSLAGLRVGYAVGPEPLVGALMKIRDSYNVDAIAQRLAIAALRDRETLRANVGRIQATRRRLGDGLAALGFTVCPSEANFVWARPAGLSAAELFARLRERHIFVRHFPGPSTGEFVRISVGTDGEIERLLGAVRELTAGGSTR